MTNDMRAAVFGHLAEHWHVGMAGSAQAADILRMNPNTLKTRLARGQALMLRHPSGEAVKPLTFTGFHLIYNMLQDRFMRYGFTQGDGADLDHTVTAYAEWIKDNVIEGQHKTSAILRLMKDREGNVSVTLFEDGEITNSTGDAAVIIPIGDMVLRFGFFLFMRSGDIDKIQRLTSRGDVELHSDEKPKLDDAD